MTESVPTRGSLRSRSAALLSMATLRQISAVLPPEQALGLWASRRIIADIRAAGGRCALQVWPDQVIDNSMCDNGIEAISGKAG